MVSPRKEYFALILSLGAMNLLIGLSSGYVSMSPKYHQCMSSTFPRTRISIESFVTTSRGYSKSNTNSFVSETALFGKRNRNDFSEKRKLSIPSLVRLLPGIPANKNSKTTAIDTGLETALVLGNKQRRAQWTQEASQKFSWIPTVVLSSCIDNLASAYEAVAPRDLRRALRPGGLPKVRSKIQTRVVEKLQPILQSLPLPKSDKEQLVEYLVDLSLDFFLKDLEAKLAAPSTKLVALEKERREILQIMTNRERIWYQLRYKPKMTIGLGLLSVWTIFVTLWFVQENRANVLFGIQQFLSSSLSVVTGIFLRGLSSAQSLILKLTNSILSWLK